MLNNEPGVGHAMRERVPAGLRALGMPTMPTHRLVDRRSFLIAMLYDGSSPHYVMEVRDGVLEACYASRCPTVVRQLQLPLNPLDCMGHIKVLIMQSRPDGIVLTPPLCNHAPLVDLLRAQNIPFASIFSETRHQCTGVALDDRSAACAMVHHLAALGHRRIAHIAGPTSHRASSWYLRGYRDGLKEAGLPFDPALVVAGESSFDSVVTGAHYLFALQPRPTAVLSGSDDMATAALWAAAACGLKVPDDVSICGFDDMPMPCHSWPSLTTLSRPNAEMGRIAMEGLLRVIEFKKRKDAVATASYASAG